ncbi:TPA: fimbrial protein [Serratia fonticola]
MKGILKIASRVILAIVSICLFSSSVWAGCSGSTVTSQFTPANISISKSTPIGQVVSSATVTVTVTCTSAGAPSGQTLWRLNYTPQNSLVSSSLSQGVFNTSMPGLGYRMYGTTGTVIKPTSYGTNGGDNFGTGGTGANQGVPLNSTNSFQFRLELVRTDTSLSAGTFSSSLVRFGYQYASGGKAGCPESSQDSGCTAQFGAEITSPVQFQFIAPMCTVSNDQRTLEVTLPDIQAVSFTGVGTSLGETPLNINLSNCVTQTNVVMTMNGTADSQPSVLKTNGQASGIGVQVLNGGSPVVLNSPLAIGNVGDDTNMVIPLSFKYYQTMPNISVGNISATSTITFTYN